MSYIRARNNTINCIPLQNDADDAESETNSNYDWWSLLDIWRGQAQAEQRTDTDFTISKDCESTHLPRANVTILRNHVPEIVESFNNACLLQNALQRAVDDKCGNEPTGELELELQHVLNPCRGLDIKLPNTYSVHVRTWRCNEEHYAGERARRSGSVVRAPHSHRHLAGCARFVFTWTFEEL